MSNSDKMSLEDKIVQTIKDDKLFALVADEDAINELVKRAIHEALYQPTRIPKQYGGYDEADSIAVKSAKEIARRIADKLVGTIADEMLADEKIKKLVIEAMAIAMPHAISGSLSQSFYNFGQSVMTKSFEQVSAAIRDKATGQ